MSGSKYVLITTTSVITILFLFLIGLLFSVILFSFSPNESTISSTSTLYQLMEISVKEKSTNYGFARLGKEFSSDSEYLSYRNEESGNYFVISNFASNKFECEGSCVCTTDENRRQPHSTLLSRGLYLAVSAFSSLVAVKIANDAFREDCLQEFSGSCDPIFLTTDEVECSQKLINPKSEISQESEGNNEVEAKDDEDEYELVDPMDQFIGSKDYDNLEYECWGYCIRNENVRNRYGRWIDNEKILGHECKDLTLKASVDVVEAIEYAFDKIYGEGEYPKYRFAETILNPYCEGRTERFYFWDEEEYRSPMCVGIDNHRIDFPHIKCNKVPKSRRIPNPDSERPTL